MTRILALLAVCVAMVAAYPGGPPIGSSHPTLCNDMVPTGHGATAQTVDAPYVYVLSTDNCYKAGMEIKVAIKANASDADAKYFEGFFTQVQKKTELGTSYGTFATEDDEYSQLLTCFSTANNSIGQKKHAHFDTRVFTWTAPDSDQGDLYLRSTIVNGKTTFWVNVYSAALKYDSACAAGAFTETNTKQPGTGSSSEEDTSQASSVLPGILTAIATLLFALLL